MDNLISWPNNWEIMHHAYIVSGSTSEEVWQLLLGLKFAKQANPDALALEFETFGIEEARELATWANKKAFGERKVAVITLKSFTSEAQNALLKLFEDPPEQTYFFILLENPSGILPTLLSRVLILENKNAVQEENMALTFLKSDISKRFKIINPIIKNKDKDKAKDLVSGLSRQLKSASEIESILKAKKYLGGRAPSLKMILESLALTLR